MEKTKLKVFKELSLAALSSVRYNPVLAVTCILLFLI